MDGAIEMFITISQTDRRTALYFLERQNGDINNAMEDYFNQPSSFQIPSDFMPEGNPESHDNPPSSDYSNSEPQENPDNSYSDNNNNNSDIPNNDENEVLQETPVNIIIQTNLLPKISDQTQEINSSAIISDFKKNEDELNDSFFQNSQWPKSCSKGSNLTVSLYSDGILISDTFLNKSLYDYQKAVDALQCGKIPEEFSSKGFVDVEICDFRDEKYAK